MRDTEMRDLGKPILVLSLFYNFGREGLGLEMREGGGTELPL